MKISDRSAIKFSPETNIKGVIEGSILTLTIDLTKNQGNTKSGKSLMIATTGPVVEVQPGVMLGLNLYKKHA